jgi:hypothetical protein
MRHCTDIFDNDYLREHVSLGYAVTVHSAQGVTADISHAVLGENTSRALPYVAMTRGRHTNTTRLYQHTTEAHEYSRHQPDGTRLKTGATTAKPPTSSTASSSTTNPPSPPTTTPHKPHPKCRSEGTGAPRERLARLRRKGQGGNITRVREG